MNRRLKDRIPAALQAGVRRLPALVLVVSATFVLTPEALARVESGEAEPVLVLEKQSPYVFKTYTKEELRQKVPENPVPDLNTRITAEVQGLFRRLTANQTDANAWNAMRTAQPDSDTVRTHLSALKEKPTTGKADPNRIRAFLATESQKALSQRVKSGLTILDKLNAGLDFNLNLGSLFSDDDTPKLAQPTQAGALRYGLILQDITPDKNAPSRAAINDSAEELRFAGHADVRWTIGPLTEEESRRLFDFSEQAPAPPEKASLWERVKSHLAFRSKATPENLDNLAKVNDANMPGMRLELSQVDGFYTLTHRMDSKGKRLAAEHQVVVPTGIGGLGFGRRFDDSFQIVQTSAYNLLIDKRLPILSVHHMHLEQRYKGELGTTIDGHTVSVGAQGKATGPIPAGATPQESYSLNYLKNF